MRVLISLFLLIVCQSAWSADAKVRAPAAFSWNSLSTQQKVDVSWTMVNHFFIVTANISTVAEASASMGLGGDDIVQALVKATDWFYLLSQNGGPYLKFQHNWLWQLYRMRGHEALLKQNGLTPQFHGVRLATDPEDWYLRKDWWVRQLKDMESWPYPR